MRVRIVNQHYPPQAVPLPTDLAQGLAARHYQMKVPTGLPNHPSGTDFPGYRQRWQSIETEGSAEIHPIALFSERSQRAVKRVRNYCSCALNSATAGRTVMGVFAR